MRAALSARAGPPALLLVLLALALPAGAEAFFSAPLDITAGGQNASTPKVAVDQDGDAVFVWTARDGTTDCGGSGCLRIQARTRSAAGFVSRADTLSDPGQHAGDPQVAVDQDGDAVFVWRRSDGTTDCGGSACDGVEARARSAAGVLSATQTLSVAGQSASIPQLGVDQDGDAVFVWMARDGTTDCDGSGCFRIQARARSATGVLSAAPQILSVAGQSAFSPQVAVDQDGDAVFAWFRRDGTTDCGGSSCDRIQARARSAAGTLSAIQNLSAAGEDATSPQVAIDQAGDAVFAWGRPDATTDCGGSGCDRIEARARSAAGALSGVGILSAAGQDAFSPQVAVDQDGDAVFAWTRRDGTTACGGSSCTRIQARARSAAGALSAIDTLSDPGQNAVSSDVAVDQAGDAALVWMRRDGTTGCGGSGCLRIQARARSAAGVLSATETLSAAGEGVLSRSVAVDRVGHAVAVWLRPDGTTGCGGIDCNRVQAAVAIWGPAVDLSEPGQDASGAHVAVDQDGDAVFVWTRRDATTDCGGSGCDRVQTQTRSAAGVLSAIETLSPAGQSASSPQVAVDQDGDAVFVWVGRDGTTDCGGSGCLRIQARARSAAGALSAIQTLSGAGQHAFEPQVAIDADGDAVFAWRRRDGTTGCFGSGCLRLQTRARSAAGALSAIQTLSAAGRDAEFFEVAVDQEGDAVFAWARSDGTTGFCCDRIQVRARSAAGALSATQTLSGAGQNAFDPQVAVDADGDAVLVWGRVDGTTDCGGSACTRIQVRARSAAGVLEQVQTLSPAGARADEPDAAIDADGDALVVWGRTEGGTGIQARARSAVGVLGPVQDLSPVGSGAFVPGVAMDADGDAIAVWGRRDETTDCGGFGCLRIEARARSAGGVLRPTEIVSGAGQGAFSPQVAVDADGDAVAVWLIFSTGCPGSFCDRVQAATSPP